MAAPSHWLARWAVDRTDTGEIVTITLSSGSRWAVKVAQIDEVAAEGVLFCTLVDGRDLVIAVSEIAAAENQGE